MAATTVEIPRDTWPEFFNDVGRLFPGWATTVEVLAGELGDQPGAQGLPLQGISYDYKGGSQAGDILVEVGEKGMPFHTRLVHRPVAVRAAPLQPGVETDIEIDSAEGVTYLVRIRRRPELPGPAGERAAS
jgi:hypothetical protein